MSIFTRPLVALSLTEPDAGLLRYASRALTGGCEEVCFAHVAAGTSEPDAAQRQDLIERMQREVQTHFGEPGLRGEFDIAHGSRLDQLLILAAERRSDVVLLGHRRERSGRRALARRLAMTAPCSVWLAPEGSPAQVEKIIVPVDFSQHSADALSLATSLAAARNIPSCLALHVFFDRSSVRYPEHVDEVVGDEKSAFDEFLAGVDCHGVQVEPLLEESADPPGAILRAAKRHDADLIVMNTRGRTHAAAVLLGSVTSKTMAASAVPVLAVKHFGSHETLLEVLLNHRFWEKSSVKTN